MLGSGGLCVARAEPFTISYFNTIVPSIVDNPQVLYRLFSMSFKAEKDHIVYFSLFFYFVHRVYPRGVLGLIMTAAALSRMGNLSVTSQVAFTTHGCPSITGKTAC